MKLEVTSKSIHWKTIIDAFSTLHDEMKFVIKEDGLNFSILDPSHVAMLKFFWKKENFAKFTTDEKTLNIEIGINIEDLSKVFKRIDQLDDVTISIKDANVTISTPTKSFELRAMDGAHVDTPTPKIQYSESIEMTLAALKEIVLDVASIADNITFIGKDGLMFYEGKDEKGKAKGQIDAKSKTDFKADFSLEYLRPFVSSITATTIEIEFASAKPMHIKIPIESMGVIDYWLAPRVES